MIRRYRVIRAHVSHLRDASRLLRPVHDTIADRVCASHHRTAHFGYCVCVCVCVLVRLFCAARLRVARVHFGGRRVFVRLD